MSTTRQLVTVRTIDKVLPIDGADAVALAEVDGWQVVIKKNEFQSGDKALYFEIDSFIPLSDPRFAFLTRGERLFNGVRGIRIKTIKLRGQVSQGLLIPLDNFPDVVEALSREGMEDFSELLGVIKYEIDEGASVGGMQKGNFPSFIPRTDERRVQNLSNALEFRKDETFEISMKLDGSSMTVYRLQNDPSSYFGVCSRNNEMKEATDGEVETNAFWLVARRDRLEDALALFDGNWAISGELLGPRIQHNREKFSTYQFFVFNIFDITKGAYVSPEVRRNMVKKMQDAGFDVKHVPVLETHHVLTESVSDILKMAIGESLNHPVREGIVFKSNDSQFSFKAISNKFLLKYDDADS